MKVSIIFHSVCGNTYLMAKEIYTNFEEKGVQVNIFRVKDEDALDLSNVFPVIKE